MAPYCNRALAGRGSPLSLTPVETPFHSLLSRWPDPKTTCREQKTAVGSAPISLEPDEQLHTQGVMQKLETARPSTSSALTQPPTRPSRRFSFRTQTPSTSPPQRREGVSGTRGGSLAD